MTWTHDALAADLMDTRHLFGEIAIERLGVRGGVLDVAAMRLSWSRPLITGYEIKISRSDFWSDVRAGKFRHYLDSVERLYFAVPRGLVEKSEVPAECGVVVRGDRGWTWLRAAPRRALDPHRRAGFVQAVLFRHYGREGDGAWRVRRHAMAKATTPDCDRCGHPMGLHSYGACRYGSDCKCWRPEHAGNSRPWEALPAVLA